MVGERLVFGEPSAGKEGHGRERGEEIEFLAGGEAEEDEDGEDPEDAEETGLAAAVGIG